MDKAQGAAAVFLDLEAIKTLKQQHTKETSNIKNLICRKEQILVFDAMIRYFYY